MTTDLIHVPGDGMTMTQLWKACGVPDYNERGPLVYKVEDPHMIPDKAFIGAILQVRLDIYGDHGSYVTVWANDPMAARACWYRSASRIEMVYGEVMP